MKLKRFNEGITEGPEKGNQKFVTSPRPNIAPSPQRVVNKTYSEDDVVSLLMEMSMDILGDEWVAAEDDNFKSWLDKNGLLQTWEKIYGDI